MNRTLRRLLAFSLVSVVTVATTALGTSSVFAQGRDAFLWPFASNSIWNTPIHTSAVYKTANFQGESDWYYGVDLEYILYVDDNTPYVPAYEPGDPYRDTGTTQHWINQVRVPNWFYVNDVSFNPRSTPNNCAAFVYFGSQGNSGMSSGGVIESQPTTRISSNKISGWFQKFGSIYGSGLGDPDAGAHFGSGLSVLGGSIRGGELTSSTPIRHALKFEVSGAKYLYYSDSLRGFKWPAKFADNYAGDPTSDIRYAGSNPNIVQGSLVAIPRRLSVNDLGLTSSKAKKVAQALLDYGAYIVDDTAYTSYAFVVSQEEVGQWDIPKSDFQKIVKALCVVTNNGPDSIGGKTGSGTPRVPYAPNF